MQRSTTLEAKPAITKEQMMAAPNTRIAFKSREHLK
jgi:hypothetical protein